MGAAGQLIEVLPALDVQLKSPRQRVEDLRGRVLVATLLQPEVVVGADAGQQRQFLAAEPADAAARTGYQPDVIGLDLFPTRSQVLAEGIASRHHLSLRLSLPVPGSSRLPHSELHGHRLDIARHGREQQ